jgi:hypothetical protein
MFKLQRKMQLANRVEYRNELVNKYIISRVTQTNKNYTKKGVKSETSKISHFGFIHLNSYYDFFLVNLRKYRWELDMQYRFRI